MGIVPGLAEDVVVSKAACVAAARVVLGDMSRCFIEWPMGGVQGIKIQ